jgi:isoleucyl-tRNA synthetase
MVALDTEINEELEMLGLARELVSRIQSLRKESGLEITDRIRLKIVTENPLLESSVTANTSYIQEETLTANNDIVISGTETTIINGKEELINNLKCRILLEKSSS